MLGKAATIKRFEYSKLPNELKKQASTEKNIHLKDWSRFINLINRTKNRTKNKKHIKSNLFKSILIYLNAFFSNTATLEKLLVFLSLQNKKI